MSAHPERYTFVIVGQVIGAESMEAAQIFLDQWWEEMRPKHPAGQTRFLNASIMPVAEFEPDDWSPL